MYNRDTLYIRMFNTRKLIRSNLRSEDFGEKEYPNLSSAGENPQENTLFRGRLFFVVSVLICR